MSCKVVLATLRTELTQIQDSGYTAVDPTSPKLSTPYCSFMASIKALVGVSPDSFVVASISQFRQSRHAVQGHLCLLQPLASLESCCKLCSGYCHPHICFFLIQPSAVTDE